MENIKEVGGEAKEKKINNNQSYMKEILRKILVLMKMVKMKKMKRMKRMKLKSSLKIKMKS